MNSPLFNSARLVAGLVSALVSFAGLADPVRVQCSGSTSTVQNPVEGTTDTRLVWEDEKSSVGFLFDRALAKNTVYTASFKIGQCGGKRLFWHCPHYGNQIGFPGGIVREGDWKVLE
ncbi:hypothetical protein [Crateriforma conspicua]|uniref:Uncharacterized protein n=1 Tax=Crateriforma conspicua TaxID=2527996 RepID=A0A5C6FXH8_9PLAN|nr:hypothetical protein [Crateriforma conspicua]TWU67096.1 hypothetical protein V7x_26690 [Crateriforma conspicua]